MRPSTNALAAPVISCGLTEVSEDVFQLARTVVKPGESGGGFGAAAKFLRPLLFLGAIGAVTVLPAAAQTGGSAGAGNSVPAPRLDVRDYVVKYNPLVFTNAPEPALSKYAGTNVGLEQVEQAASAALLEFQQHGYQTANISVSLDQATNGVVTLNIFQGAFPQILISGKSYPVSTNLVPAATAPTETNATPHITVVAYQVLGNSLLSDETMQSIFSKYVGTNITINDIEAAEKDLLLEYRARGYYTVSVGLPQQKLFTNGIITMAVFEGKLTEINVVGNRYYSSNNVMRSLPSLKTNMTLNTRVFQEELNRANANQDRQIYPQLTPGPGLAANSTILNLKVQDRFPLHAKIELNNQSSPGTPDLRIASSAVYNNLWQLDHSLGVQYSFSPTQYKHGDQWSWYDLPLVANYSGFYRLPLGNAPSEAEAVASRPGTFGFNEATRRFELPPASGAPELNVFASRSTIDSGVNGSPPDIVLQNAARTIISTSTSQDLTVNEDLGFRLSKPLRDLIGIHSTASIGLDLKTYQVQSDKSLNYEFIEILHHTPGDAGYQQIGFLSSPLPTSFMSIQYLPFSLRLDANRTDDYGNFNFGVGYSPNLWFSGGVANVQAISGSTETSGYWQIITGNLGREQILYRDWRLAVRADGQWANQPLISNEQFGDGGVAGVRGYREGEVFGDTGWRVTSELKTPVHNVGLIGGNPSQRLTIRGSIFMDYGDTYLLDPQGRPPSTPLWGTGLGGAANIGSHGEIKLLFGWPLLNTPTSEAGQLRLSFSMNVQF